MAELKSVALVGAKGVKINNTRYLRSFDATIKGYILSIIPSQQQSESYNGDIREVEINGTVYANPDDALTALEFIGNFKSGGSSPSPTGAAWGGITGNIANQVDLIARFENKANIPITANTFYIDVNGDNTNDGLTAATPFQTVAYALWYINSYVIPEVSPGVGSGVTLNLAAGEYGVATLNMGLYPNIASLRIVGFDVDSTSIVLRTISNVISIMFQNICIFTPTDNQISIWRGNVILNNVKLGSTLAANDNSSIECASVIGLYRTGIGLHQVGRLAAYFSSSIYLPPSTYLRLADDMTATDGLLNVQQAGCCYFAAGGVQFQNLSDNSAYTGTLFELREKGCVVISNAIGLRAYLPNSQDDDVYEVKTKFGNTLYSIKAYLSLSSNTTQVIDSNIALDHNSKLLGTDTNNTEHVLITHEEYSTGQQTEIGSTEDALCMNWNALGWDGTPQPQGNRPLVNYKDVNGVQQVDSLPLYGEDFVPLKTVVDSLVMGGIKIGSFVNKATVPTVPSSNLWLKTPTENDFFTVQADESEGGARTQYYVTAVDLVNDTISIAFDGAFENTEEDILITSFDGITLSASVPEDGKIHRVYWNAATPGAPQTTPGSGMVNGNQTQWCIFCIYSTTTVSIGAVTKGDSNLMSWRTIADRTWATATFQPIGNYMLTPPIINTDDEYNALSQGSLYFDNRGAGTGDLICKLKM